MKSNQLLKYIIKNPGITIVKLKKITKVSKTIIFDYIKKFEEKELILKLYESKKNTYKIYVTEKGKQEYLKNKIKFLIKNNIICEENSLAPCICDGCIYYNDKLAEFCDLIECHSDKIFIYGNKISRFRNSMRKISKYKNE